MTEMMKSETTFPDGGQYKLQIYFKIIKSILINLPVILSVCLLLVWHIKIRSNFLLCC